ncbi:MAG TPA: thiol reductase thioredoxin, partial [Polyangiaceae bacterium]|nr:thiol reductase thioredoxin [Polyangiaceae bacterium]
AMREARASGRAVFVEVWAPWCHTCLSMKNFVLPDPALAPLRERLVFAAVDSDREDNAAFMDRYAVNVWPTLFVLEPEGGEVVSLWQGSASVSELRTFLQDALDAMDAEHAPDGPLAAMLAAKKAHAAGDWPRAAQHYQRALDRGGADWPRRSEALAGLVFSEYRQGHWTRCAQLGADHAASIEGAAVPADFSWVVLDCAAEVKAPALRDRARAAVLARLKRHTDSPPDAASVDDRSDALAIYAGALAESGDRAGERAAREKQIALLEAAAAEAPGPKEAATFDYARMGAYLALGRGSEAVAMLRERRAQLPDSYEPPARLAQALIAMRKDREAVEPLEDAVSKAYGPRKLGYLATLAELRARLGDRSGQREALVALLALYDGLSASQRAQRANRKRAEQARRQLARLR